ncbi:MFS transporter [Propionivibrio dicarboxylicus]|uniref:Predicted arabinose efflux permease, MFS family n=1 Tax=Propionivibrio dicarboxylicus TaxID=83767 RepID=A0A1G7VQ63_9RHOO|nr:MFS transporter [Propionivibrio dicarboxylicus]SDG61874.1 Predicted arabinose efflux permease, MFS family [Propionivibrio dicarboxylicus]
MLGLDRRPGADRQASPAVIWLIGFFGFINLYSMQSILPLVSADFGASPLQAGATVGATVLAVALVSPFMGMLSDALGRKVVICWSLFGLAVPTALIPLAHGLDSIVLLRFLQGLAIPGIVVTITAYIGEEFSGDQAARITSVYMGGAVMGGFSGRFITGHASHLLGWRGAFVTLVVLNLIGAVVAVWRLPASRRFVANTDPGQAFRTIAMHLRNPRLLAACAVGFCVLFSLVGSFTYVNFLLAAPPFELSAAGLANIFCVYLLGVVITPLAGRFIVRFGFLHALLIALGISSLGIATTLVPALTAVIAGLAICSSGVFICQAATISFIARHVPNGRSSASGLYYLAYYAGGAAGTGIGGLAFEAWTWQGTVVAMILVQALAGLIAWLGWRAPDTAG